MLRELIFKNPNEQKRVNLKGAVQISQNTYFVYAEDNGNTFLKNHIDSKLHKKMVQNMINANPKVVALLGKFKIKPFINIVTLKDLANGHMNETCKIAEGVYSILSDNLKSKIDRFAIKEASMLHDLGKVLIPSKILNKPAKLNLKEREIMNIHSVLGYELLKTQHISEDTLELIKYHHQNLIHSGYPALEGDKTPSDIGVQLISIADKYSALREVRVYRRKMTRLEALLVLYKEVREGKILPEVFNALVVYAQKYDTN